MQASRDILTQSFPPYPWIVSVAGYYTVLAKAVATLVDPTPAAREELYRRARAAMDDRLRSIRPPLSHLDIGRQSAAFREAVRRIERELAPAETPRPGSRRARPRIDSPIAKPLPATGRRASAAATAERAAPPARPRSGAPESKRALALAGAVAVFVSVSFGIWTVAGRGGVAAPASAAPARLARQPQAAVASPDRPGQATARATDAAAPGVIADLPPHRDRDDEDDDETYTVPIAAEDVPRMALNRFRVREVFDGMALVDSPYGLTFVQPGLVLPGAGRVIAIRQQRGKWVVATPAGDISEAGE